jgi:hypothetical protein
MASGNGTSSQVRPPAETRSSSGRRDLDTSADFDRALALGLAPLDRLMPRRQRTEALARARQQIVAAAEVTMKAEKRRIVAALTPVQLRKEVRELITSHEQLLDYIDTIERWPRIGEELKRLRCRGEIPWPL